MFAVPALYSVHVVTTWGALNVSAHLTCHHLPDIASGLLAWADTLPETITETWRTPSGDSVHLSVIGQLPDDVSTRVYGGMAFTQRGIGADLTPDTNTTVPLAILRHLATPGEVTAC
ncbi:MAG: hypothetical protein WCF33_05195 [Pseudonocardiaceae bacterium]